MDTNTAEGSSGVSKADTLRGFVTQRLAAASREILAVIETVVAAYEEEASGFREEITRQRRQLEVQQPQLEVQQPQLEVQQPPVTDSTAGLQTSRNQRSVHEEEGEAKESHEHLQNQDWTGLSSSSGPDCQFAQRKAGRPQISRSQNAISLSIRILEDSSINILSKNVLKKSLMVLLKCPCGLQEDDFLELLRSTVPQLSGDKPFDILTSDKRRRLQPLILKTVTPEEIYRNIKSFGPGRSIIYIRLKTAGQKETGNISPDALTREETRRLTSNHFQKVEDSTSTSKQEMETDDDDGAFPQLDVSVAPPAAERENNTSDVKTGDDEDADCSSWRPDGTRRNPEKHSDITESENNADAFSCKVCGVPLRSELLLVQHAASHEEEVGSACGVCGASVQVLMEHLQREHRTDDCPVCGESFLSAVSLNEHVTAHSSQQPASLKDHQQVYEPGHTCPTCSKVFKLEMQLKAHRRTHYKRKPFLCGVCGKLLCDRRSLSRHKMTHSGERPHRCQVCGREFKLHTTLRQHEKIHMNRERSYLCDVCCKMFLTSVQLIVHMRTHTKEKLFHCDQCGKGFSAKGALKIHMRVHTGETPYCCSFCNRAFKRKSNLDDHVGTHTGAKPHVCKICGKSCARKTYLTVHMRTHNGERPYKCTVCDKAFTQSHCLKTHMKSHQSAA